mgnify:CR=1 FL=1
MLCKIEPSTPSDSPVNNSYLFRFPQFFLTLTIEQGRKGADLGKDKRKRAFVGDRPIGGRIVGSERMWRREGGD